MKHTGLKGKKSYKYKTIPANNLGLKNKNTCIKILVKGPKEEKSLLSCSLGTAPCSLARCLPPESVIWEEQAKRKTDILEIVTVQYFALSAR